jgi:hypothetical protein
MNLLEKEKVLGSGTQLKNLMGYINKSVPQGGPRWVAINKNTPPYVMTKKMILLTDI